MKNIIITCLTAALLFAVSAGISLYLQNPSVLKGPDKDKDSAKDDSKDKDKPAPRRAEDTTAIVPPTATTPNDQVTRLLARLQEREQALQRREADAKKQEGRVEIVMEDVRGERAVIDTLRKQLSDELGKLNKKEANLASTAKGLDEQKEAAKKILEEMKKRQSEIEAGESTNISRMASLLDSMEPEKAAAIVRQLADGGKTDTAVKVLGLMKERKAAQLLAAMTDVTLAAELLEKLRGLKRTSAAAKKDG